MAVYKVPQDVEADDKLIGPFSFRQFVYLIIVAAAIAIAWFLSRIFLPLLIIPLPVIVFFGALALPLRKDQPMETYLAAIVSFYLKPRKRLWDPDGQQSLVEITAPKVVETQLTKDFSQDEAERRLSYLANIVDSHGWAVRGVQQPTETNSSLNSDIFYEAQQVPDVLDASARTAQTIGNQLDQANARHRQELVDRLQHPAAPQPTPAATPAPAIPNPYASLSPTLQDATNEEPVDEPHLNFNPYPTSMHQSVIKPISEEPAMSAPQPQAPPQTPSEKVVSPDIINLANNPDLSIETIAHEANRIKQKQELGDEEVTISLR